MSLAIGKSARKCSMSVFCQKTAFIPIVVAAIGDAMAAGIVHSLAKPKGNVTSLTFLNTELSAKRIELLKVALPMMQRLSVFNDLNSQASYLEETPAAAKGLGIQMQHIDLPSPEDFEQASDQARRGAAEAVNVLASSFFNANRGRLVRFAAQYRLPTIYESREYAEASGLMTYGQDLALLFRRVAAYVEKILRAPRLPTFRGSSRPSSSWRSRGGQRRARVRQHCIELCAVGNKVATIK